MADMGLSEEWHTNGNYANQVNDECPGGNSCDCQHRAINKDQSELI